MTPEPPKEGGYLFLWRSLTDNPLWGEMPYSTGKLWLWLLMEATHEGNTIKRRLPPGQLNHSISFIQQALVWLHPEKHQEITPSNNTIRKGLKALVDAEMITWKASRRAASLITICQWYTYQPKYDGGSTSDSTTDSTRPKKVQEVPEDKRHLQVYPSEVETALKIWTDLAPLPSTANLDACRKTLSELHRIDKLPWDRINAICEYAAREWVPQKFIGSPVKLRQPTRSGEMKTWEAIERQLEAKSNHGGGRNGYPGKESPADTALALFHAAESMFNDRLPVVGGAADKNLLPEFDHPQQRRSGRTPVLPASVDGAVREDV